MNRITRSLRNLRRFLTIANVFLSLLIDLFLQRIYFPEEDKKKKSKFRRFWGKFFAFIFRRDVKKVDYPVIFRLALERLGPTFIKFGQILSLRKDFVPEELCQELEKLQDKVPPIPFEDIIRIVELEFREPLYKIYPEFEKTPIGSASLSQIHSAYIEENTKVAVKIQRPGIRRIILNDINILKSLANILEKFIPSLRDYQLSMFVREFESYTLRELDFKIEGFHSEKFASNFKDEPKINFPKIFWNRTTSKILTMEFIEGIKPKEASILDKHNIDRVQAAETAANAVLKMLFIDGFFHGDPHPGNILITKNNDLYFIDLGMIGTFSESVKNYMFLYYYYMGLSDYENAVKNFTKMLRTTKESDVEGFKAEMVALISKFSTAKLEEVSLAQIIIDTLQIGVKYKVYFPGDTFLMAKSLITIESIGTMLVPGLVLNEITRPFARRIFIERFGFDNIVKGFARSAPDIIEFLQNFPQIAINTIKRIETGGQNVNIITQDSDAKARRKDTSILSKSILIGVFTVCGTFFIDAYSKDTTTGILVTDIEIFGQEIPLLASISFLVVILLTLSIILSKKD